MPCTGTGTVPECTVMLRQKCCILTHFREMWTCSHCTQEQTLFYTSGPERSSQSCGYVCVLGDQSVCCHLPAERNQTNKFKLHGQVLFPWACDLIPASWPMNVCVLTAVCRRGECVAFSPLTGVFSLRRCSACVNRPSAAHCHSSGCAHHCMQVCASIMMCVLASCDLCAVHATNFSLF